MKKKTKDKDIWVYSAVGIVSGDIRHVHGVCKAFNEEEALGIAFKQLCAKDRLNIKTVGVEAFKLDLEGLK